GRNHVYFLPYLMGERSPINDTDARGMFIGMSMDTSRADMVQAVLEGVAFAIRDSFEVAKSLGVKIERSRICGGGARSELWRNIMANVLDLPLEIPQTEEGPGYGAAMLAMVGCGAYASVQEAASALVRTTETVLPQSALAERYETAYRKYRKIYPTVKYLYKELQ
ncbi:MAG: xylulokinase, partial [Clostridia bacterium]|nr:xylulokinase [Clostridia bacterium]